MGRGEAVSTSAKRRILGKAGLKNGESALAKRPAQPSKCPECTSQKVWRDGLRSTRHGDVQRWLCRNCGYRFSQPNIEVQVTGQTRAFHSCPDLAEPSVRKGNLPFKKPLNDCALSFSEDVGSHTVTLVGKRLNNLRSYNCKRQCMRHLDEGAKNLVTVETRLEKAAGATGKINSETQGKIVEWLWHLKKKGLAECSIYAYAHRIRWLARKCNILEPEEVKEVIAKQKWASGTKAYDVIIYNEFAKWLKLEWEPPIYKIVRKLPYIPTEAVLDQLIAASGPKLSTFLQLLKETGMRKGEAERLSWTDFDFERKLVQINKPEKGSNPRILPISSKLIGMLQRLRKGRDRVFSFTMSHNFYLQRKNIIRKLNNPKIRQIKLHTLRHWKGTLEYHKTHDIIHVQQILGHRSIKSTMLYIHLEQAIFQSGNDEFHVAVAKTVNDACKLVEVGFEYVTGEYNDGGKIFRKRK